MKYVGARARLSVEFDCDCKCKYKTLFFTALSSQCQLADYRLRITHQPFPYHLLGKTQIAYHILK